MKLSKDEILRLAAEELQKNKEVILKMAEGCEGLPHYADMGKALIANGCLKNPNIKWTFLETGHGIKCDAEGCDFRKDYPSFDYLHLWLGVPCPKCGANLLTEQDWFTTKLLNKIMGNPIVKLLNKMGKKEDRVLVEVKMNGTGKVDFDIKKLQQ